MIKAEDLSKINEKLATIDVKGKQYVMVNERVKAFREICPNGTITTDIVSMAGGIVTMKATVKDGENVLGTGYAQEKETSSYINKTSYIENCETSAVGRALGFAGIGIDGSMASAEEVANAIINQNKGKSNEPNNIVVLRKMLKEAHFSEKSLLEHYGHKSLSEVTPEEEGEILQKCKAQIEANEAKANGKQS